MKVLLINAMWSNTPANPWPIAQAQKMADFCRAWYLAGSYGKVSLDFSVSPFIRLGFPDTSARMPVDAEGNAQLTALGLSPHAFERQIYLTTRSAAVGSKGFCWGTGMWVNCMNSDYAQFAMIHEFGHSLGLSHPYQLQIGQQTGKTLSIPSLDVTTGGQLTAYYDKSTSMGYEASMAQFSAPEKASMHWIVPEIYAGGDKTYTLTASSAQGGTLYAVEIPMSAFRPSSKRVYWIEYRTDTIGQNGIQIRVTGDFGCSAPGHINSALQTGDRFTDGTIVIDVMDAGVVRIRTATSVRGLATVPRANA